MAADLPPRTMNAHLGENDPISGHPIAMDDSVVRCQTCLRYQLEESWAQASKCAFRSCEGLLAWSSEDSEFSVPDSEAEDHDIPSSNMREYTFDSNDAAPDTSNAISVSQERKRVRIEPADVRPRRRSISITFEDMLENSETDEEPREAVAFESVAQSENAQQISISPRRSDRAEEVSDESSVAVQPVVSQKKGTRKLDRSRISGVGWDTEVLDSARILVVGAGAIGNEVLKNLALLGVGNIFVVDLDTIDASNLTRAILFSEFDIDRPKVDVVKDKLGEIEKEINVQTHQGMFQSKLGLGAFRRFDVVFSCVDNYQARIDLAAACLATGTLMLEGGVIGLDGQASITFPPESACFDCTLTKVEREGAQKRISCPGIRYGEADRPSMPFTPTISSIVGGMMTQWAMQGLHGTLDKGTAKRMRLTAGDGDCQILRFSRSLECPTHEFVERITEFGITNRNDWTLDMTAANVFDTVRDVPGLENGKLMIYSGFSISRQLKCSECGYVSRLHRRFGELLLAESICPNKCEESKIMDPEWAENIQEGDELASESLRELAFRSLDCLSVKNEDTGVSHWFEISGDADELFGDFLYGEPKDFIVVQR